MVLKGSYDEPSIGQWALIIATIGLGAIGIKACSMKMGEYHRTVEAVVSRADRNNDNVLDVDERRNLAKAIGYEGPIRDEAGELFRISYNTDGIFGHLPQGRRYFLDEQRLEDYLRSDEK